MKVASNVTELNDVYKQYPRNATGIALNLIQGEQLAHHFLVKAAWDLPSHLPTTLSNCPLCIISHCRLAVLHFLLDWSPAQWQLHDGSHYSMTQGILVSTSRLRHTWIAPTLIRRGTRKARIYGCQGKPSLNNVDGKGHRHEYKYPVHPSLFKSLITKQLNINSLNTRFNLHSTIHWPFCYTNT